VDGKYRVERLLGRGGMGAVFRALHLGTDRTVALKVIVPDFADRPDFLARFEREARACGRLRHPNIVDVTDFGYAESGGRRIAYLVMEYLDGCSLAEVLRDESQLPVAFVSEVLEQAGSALEEAHRVGILHRDLKPDNIWLEPNRRGGYTVKVLDFGLAKLGTTDAPAKAAPAAPASVSPPSSRAGDSPAVEPGAGTDIAAPDLSDEVTLARPAAEPPATGPAPSAASSSEATRLGDILGTPAYMSPEQCRGEALSPRSDVYSLGVIAYRLLAGRLPFGGGVEQLLRAHLQETPAALRSLRPKLPAEAAEIVMRALAKDPGARPASAGAFASMFAARAQTQAGFLSAAFQLFLRHARAFLAASAVGLSPVLALALLAAGNALAYAAGVRLVPASAVWPGLVAGVVLMTLGPGILLVQGAVVPAVMQAEVAPLQPIDVGSLGRRFRPRLLSYLRAVGPILLLFATMAVWQLPVRPALRALEPLTDDPRAAVAVPALVSLALLPNAPLLLMLLLLARSGSARSFQFLAPVAVVEGLSPRDTLRRANQLAVSSPASLRASRRAIVGAGATLGALWGAGFMLLARLLPREAALGVIAVPAALSFVLVAPLLAVISALTYLRARRALGEPIDKALEAFERAVLPESHWRLAERDRVATLIGSGR
jgi:serine/threonine protein kinase